MAKQERAVRTREKLIRSAAEVFDREGYAVASITTISARAGVSNGALHFHFASKAALAEAVAEAAALRLRHLVDRPGGVGERVRHLGRAGVGRDVARRRGGGRCRQGGAQERQGHHEQPRGEA